MRPAMICLFAMTLSGCASMRPATAPAPGSLPFNVGNGVGSQYGNYEMRPVGETRDAAGNRCVVFNWDRPLNKNFAIRYSSASCESRAHPVWMNTTGYTRTVIPISQSNLKDRSDR